MNIFLTSVFLLFVPAPVLLQIGGNIGGPYDLNILVARECEDVGTHDLVIQIHISRKSKKKINLSGYAVMPYGLVDTMKVYVIVSNLGKNGIPKSEFLRRNFGGACTAFKLFSPELASGAFQAMGNYKDCPKKPGNYSFDFDAKFDLAGLPVAVYGVYRIEIQVLMPNSRKIGCLLFEAEFARKKNENRKGKRSK